MKTHETEEKIKIRARHAVTFTVVRVALQPSRLVSLADVPCICRRLSRTSTLVVAGGSLLPFSVPSARAQDAAAADEQTNALPQLRRLRMLCAVLDDACDRKVRRLLCGVRSNLAPG